MRCRGLGRWFPGSLSSRYPATQNQDERQNNLEAFSVVRTRTRSAHRRWASRPSKEWAARVYADNGIDRVRTFPALCIRRIHGWTQTECVRVFQLRCRTLCMRVLCLGLGNLWVKRDVLQLLPARTNGQTWRIRCCKRGRGTEHPSFDTAACREPWSKTYVMLPVQLCSVGAEILTFRTLALRHRVFVPAQL